MDKHGAVCPGAASLVQRDLVICAPEIQGGGGLGMWRTGSGREEWYASVRAAATFSAIGAPLPSFIMGRPSRVLKVVFDAPTVLYRIGFGWTLGKRFLAVTHRGRKTGQLRETVLEVILFDPDSKESVVVSAYGTRADWYRNLLVLPALRVRTGRMDYAPEQRFLTPEETREAAIEFSRRHPWEARLVPRVLPAIGAAVPQHSDSGPVDLLASLPMVSFRPKI